MKNTTLCYIEQDGMYLMMHRNKKNGDCNRDKWIGIGGHIEENESPYDCILREAKEETGLWLQAPSYRGLITFCSPCYETEFMHLFTANDFDGSLRADCPEGDLQWISREKLFSLPMWEGDKIFLHLMELPVPFFHLKLTYKADGVLLSHDLKFCGDSREPLLISACLLGTRCRYDGDTRPLSDAVLASLSARYLLIPICGEVLGGLSVPRLPAELQPNGTVIRSDGVDVTQKYLDGALEILKYAGYTNAKIALLKARSPSCGRGRIYDGSFTGTLTDGDGITAAALIKAGVRVYTEEEVDLLCGES